MYIQLFRNIIKVSFLTLILLLTSADTSSAQSSIQIRKTLLDEPGSYLHSMNLINSLEYEGNYPLAISILNELMKDFPQNQFLLLKRGSLYQISGELFKAKEDYEKVLAIDKKIPDAMYGLIKIHEILQDWERSLSLCKNLLSDYQNNAFAVLHAGWACFQMKQFEEALKWYSTKEHHQRREMILGRAWTLIRLKDMKQARNEFEKITALNPWDYEAYNGIREIERLELNQELKEIPIASESNLKQAAELLPKLRAQERFTEAFNLSDSILANEPMNSTALSERAILFSIFGKWFEMAQCYSLLLKKETKPEYYQGRMSALFSLGRLSEAALDANEVLKTSPENVLALKIIADDFYAVGKFKNALEYYEKLPEDLWAWQGKGWCNLVLGNLPSARKAFQQILACYPGNLSALEGLKRTGE
ncbi:MAG: tetratricopeptide repeat protein [Candidatus Riflebacteria bacterium]|nr:tetratricopeptide repeat protein [Candidatus Riflebacteria bacterium]